MLYPLFLIMLMQIVGGAWRWSSFCACVEVEESRSLLSSSRATFACSSSPRYCPLPASPRRLGLLRSVQCKYGVPIQLPDWMGGFLWGWAASSFRHKTLTIINYQCLPTPYIIILNSGVFNMQSPDSSPRTIQKVWFYIITSLPLLDARGRWFIGRITLNVSTKLYRCWFSFNNESKAALGYSLVI